MESIAKRLADSIVRRIDAAAVAPLSEAALRIRRTRKDKPSTSTKPLLDTGHMRSRVRTIISETQATALADTFYAGFVQLGTTTSAKSAVPGKRILPRPFMVLDTEDVDWATEALLGFLLSGEARAAA
jgi:phage gpG-like protein